MLFIIVAPVHYFLAYDSGSNMREAARGRRVFFPFSGFKITNAIVFVLPFKPHFRLMTCQ